VSYQGRYAGSVSRFTAYAIDLAVSSAVFSLALATISYVVKIVSGHQVSWNRSNLLVAILFVVWQFVYFGYSWAVSGRTFGMAILGIRVVRADGNAVEPRQGVVRALVFPLSFLLFGLGFLGILVQREHRALHDLIAGTAVIYAWDARAARLRFLARQAELTPAGSPPPAAVTPVTPDTASLARDPPGRLVVPGRPPPRPSGPEGKPDDDQQDHDGQRLRACAPDPLRDFLAEEVRKSHVDPDPADAGHHRAQDEQPEPHPEDPGHEGGHRHGRREGVTAEGLVALGQQFPAPFLQPSRVVEHPAPAPPADLEPGHRPEHPGDAGHGQHDTHIELAFSRQRARRDQRCVAGTGQPCPHDRDEHEHDRVFGHAHVTPRTRGVLAEDPSDRRCLTRYG
jgi:uncharacterized RDD family membrane protein YckC